MKDIDLAIRKATALSARLQRHTPVSDTVDECVEAVNLLLAIAQDVLDFETSESSVLGPSVGSNIFSVSCIVGSLNELVCEMTEEVEE